MFVYIFVWVYFNIYVYVYIFMCMCTYILIYVYIYQFWTHCKLCIGTGYYCTMCIIIIDLSFSYLDDMHFKLSV